MQYNIQLKVTGWAVLRIWLFGNIFEAVRQIWVPGFIFVVRQNYPFRSWERWQMLDCAWVRTECWDTHLVPIPLLGLPFLRELYCEQVSEASILWFRWDFRGLYLDMKGLRKENLIWPWSYPKDREAESASSILLVTFSMTHFHILFSPWHIVLYHILMHFIKYFNWKVWR